MAEIKYKCRKCGAKLSPGYDFCLSCGTKFSELPPITKKRKEKKEKKGSLSSGAIAVGSVAGAATEALEFVSSMCFIATAAYGSHLSPQVKFLRYVRDIELKSTKLGTLFVNRFEWLYYKFSPEVARLMVRYPFFKRTMKWLIVTPIVYLLMAVFKPVDSIRKTLVRK
ncbi:MAG: zinc ribbon domain-containing protein [Promethearchaeota archaeon]